MLVISDERFLRRAEIIWEKGTNRSEFFRGEVNKYGRIDIGSSFLPSEIIAAYLYAQLENIDVIQARRKSIWEVYFKGLETCCNQNNVKLPFVPEYATNNGHMFYLVCPSLQIRTSLIEYLKKNGIYSVFHYLSLHKSPYYQAKHDGRALINSDRYTDQLIRLPMYYELIIQEVNSIIDTVKTFFS